MPSVTILSWLGVGAFAAAVLLGLSLGGKSERVGASIFLVGGLLSVAAQSASDELPYLVLVGLDLATAAAFTILAVRVPEKLWPGVAAVSLTLLAAFSAARLVEFPLSEAAYIAAINLSSMGVALSIIAGTIAHRFWPKAEAAAAPA